ncbi:hypothetical protein OCU04_001090 [Sclerotinia nivalis]|uniref:Uncharacterized protein n=1 Tax=Sclerotinia nivalis TaxID=352851 RepID=A0A9X0AY06_9HELO|nr:hypothetical protein OCU04_001090 [Sclerotinia nivalis]
MTEILTSAQVASSGDGYAKYYTTWEWHVVHCLFYWRKVHRKQNNAQLVVETRFNQDKHIMHCAKLILGSKDGYTTSQIFLGDHEKDNSGEHVHWTDLHEA